MSQGVFLCAFQKRGYIFAAYNLAVSIKHRNPEIRIALYHDHTLSQLHTSDSEIFDLLIPMDEKIKYTDKVFDPAKVKLSVYDSLPFEENLIIDVDSICLSDLQPVLDELKAEGGYYYSHVKGTYKRKDRNKKVVIPEMDWAYADDIWEKFSLNGHELPCTNSSFQYVKKCSQAKELFSKALENLSNPIPKESLRHLWGSGTGQADELYMNIAMAQLGVSGKSKKDYLFLGNTIDRRPIHELAKTFPILSLYGYNGYSRPAYTEYYDREMTKILGRQGLGHKYKWLYIATDKYANNIPETKSVRRVDEPKVESGLIPISETVLIDSSKLIQSYPSPKGGIVRVTNWLNCSFIEYKGKTIFCYRMESRPFCTVMKLGICLLDENLQPIKETNALLDLHSNLSGFEKGYHVEDPRLFIFNDELYLSYTDGYQMAEAKINADTLQAEESFYLNKVYPQRTEKNWTFFEDKGKLLAVYDISKNEIFEMNGENWTKLVQSEKKITWPYGEIRGGTSPIKVGNKFIAFFHSSLPIKVKGKEGRQYHMGGYEFEDSFPYSVTRISKAPIISGEYVPENIPRLSNRIYVVFPSGTIKTKDGFKVSFGYNDYQCRYVNVSNELLEQNLTSWK